MTKDIIQWITGCACFMAFISCSQTEEGVLLRKENGVYFSAQIALPATRATEQAFEAGDNISVFAFTDDQGFSTDAYAANVKYSYSDGAFHPVADAGIDYPANGGLAFWAIYPYCEQATSTFNFEVAEDQSTTATYGASDLMTASTSLTTEQNPVLSFYHRLACVKFKCSFEETEEKVTSITVNNVQRNVSINLTNNTYEGTGETASGILPHRNEDGSYKILLPPQTIAEGTTFMVVHTTMGKEYTWKVPRDLLLASGCRYTYNLKVSAGGEITFSSSINPWNPEEEAIKKRVKQVAFEDFDGKEWGIGIVYNCKYDEQGRLITMDGTYCNIASGTDFYSISYSDRSIIIENKYDFAEGSSVPEIGTGKYVYTLDDKGQVIKVSVSDAFDYGDSESTFTYTNGYITEAIHNKNGNIAKQYKQSFEWVNDKIVKMRMSETESYSISYSSVNTYKLPINIIIPFFAGYYCDIDLGLYFSLTNTTWRTHMEYLPTQIVDDTNLNPITQWIWETDNDDYVTKITETTEDGTIRYGTAYTFTYENIE